MEEENAMSMLLVIAILLVTHNLGVDIKELLDEIFGVDVRKKANELVSMARS